MEKPLLRGHFHQAMFFVALGAGVPLLMESHSSRELISASVYVICALAMFGISTLYHRVTWSPERRLFWRKLDHAGIYLMIAGSFTPVCALSLNPDSGHTLLITIWSVAFVGILQSIFFVNLPKYVSSIIYLIAGYLVVPYMGEIYARLGWMNTFLIVLGGIFYSIGAVCYALKRPVLKPEVFSYHEVFHLFVNFGAISHYLVIHELITKS